MKNFIFILEKLRCANCNKILKWREKRLIRIGKKLFLVCDYCKEICEQFKQRYDIK